MLLVDGDFYLMRLLVSDDAHLYRTPDGKVWCKSIYGYQFWQRYLSIFSTVRVVARLKDIDELDNRMLRVDGDGVEVCGIPFFQGPKQLAMKWFSIQKALKGIDDGCAAALLRMPSPTSMLVWRRLRHGIPLAGEVVYDFSDDIKYERGNIFIRLLNKIQSNILHKFCERANGVSYVTAETMQKHYPSFARLHGEDFRHFEASYSTITLSDNAFTGPRDFRNNQKLTLVLSNAAMNSERKGERVLIKVVKICRDRGYDVNAVLIGDGMLRTSFENYANELGISKYIKFTGLLASSGEVREVMKKADIFVFPTQGEGLPRGILEAMAIGMPVLSTPVGGIPEILDEKYLFLPTDCISFANAVCRLFDNFNELNEMSIINFRKSLEFKNDILQGKRNRFYAKILDICD